MMRKFRILGIIGVVAFSIFAVIYVYRTLWSSWNGNYYVKVEVEDAGNLALGTYVFMNGVKVGHVKDIYLRKENVIMSLFIDRKAKIPVGSRFQITSVGMVGSLRVNIYRPKQFDEYIKDGDLVKGLGPASTSVVLETATELVEQVNSILADLDIQGLSKDARNILREFGGDGAAKLKELVHNLQIFSQEIKGFSESNFHNVSKIVTSISQILKVELFADANWSMRTSARNYEIGISAGNIFFSKKNFENMTSGYTILFKYNVSIVELFGGLLYDTFGAGITVKLAKFIELTAKGYNSSIIETKADFIAGPLVCGPFVSFDIYNFKNTDFNFHIALKTDI